MEKQRIVITACSTLTPVGEGREQVMAAINAGIVPFQVHEYYSCIPEDPEWDEASPLVGAIVPTMDILTDGQDRFSALAIPSFTGVFAEAKLPRTALADTALFLALPHKDETIAPLHLDTQWLPQLLKRTGLMRLSQNSLEFKGKAGMFYGIEQAMQMLLGGEVKTCIVAGIDSFLLRKRVKYYDHEWRIKSESNPDGFIPGEGACMLLLETEEHALERGMTPLGIIDSVFIASEPQTIDTMKNSTGQGLCEAISSVIESSGLSQGLQAIYSSFNGENYFAFEWGTVLSRLGHLFHGEELYHHPADVCGEMGAALPLLTVLCALDDIASSESDRSHLIVSSSDEHDRCAMIIKSP